MTIKKRGCSRFGAKLLLETVEFIGFCIDFLLKNEKRVLLFQKNRAARGLKLNKCDDKILLFARSEYRIKFRLWWHKNWFPQNLLKKCTFFIVIFNGFLNRHFKWRLENHSKKVCFHLNLCEINREIGVFCPSKGTVLRAEKELRDQIWSADRSCELWHILFLFRLYHKGTSITGVLKIKPPP